MLLFLKRKGREIFEEFKYIFLNSFLCHIPFWPLRKFFYKLAGMKIGKNSYILTGTIVIAANNIIIGDRTYINEYCHLDGRSGINIGSDVTIAIYSKLITGSHHINDEYFSYNGSCIDIGDNVVVFANCTILGGAYIENGCVFSASSTIQKGKYKSKGIYAGNPAILIGNRSSSCTYKQDYWHPVFR